MGRVVEFQGRYRFLSNFWYVDGTTVEHKYQASKTTNAIAHHRIMSAPTPGEAKRVARGVVLRPDWETIKVPIMLELERWKYNPQLHDELARLLDETGDDVLEEGNRWGDTFWGVCPPGSGRGQNMLGQLLMWVRGENRK